MTNIIILAAVAMFLFWRLFSILGNREGHEPQPTKNATTLDTNLSIEVEEKPSIDNDIADYIDIESDR